MVAGLHGRHVGGDRRRPPAAPSRPSSASRAYGSEPPITHRPAWGASGRRPGSPGSGPGTTATSSQPSSPQLSRICLVAWTSSGTVTYSHFCMGETVAVRLGATASTPTASATPATLGAAPHEVAVGGEDDAAARMTPGQPGQPGRSVRQPRPAAAEPAPGPPPGQPPAPGAVAGLRASSPITMLRSRTPYAPPPTSGARLPAAARPVRRSRRSRPTRTRQPPTSGQPYAAADRRPARTARPARSADGPPTSGQPYGPPTGAQPVAYPQPGQPGYPGQVSGQPYPTSGPPTSAPAVRAARLRAEHRLPRCARLPAGSAAEEEARPHDHADRARPSRIVLCGGGGAAAYFVLRDTGGTRRRPSPVDAVQRLPQGRLHRPGRRPRPPSSSVLESRDKNTLTKRVDEIKCVRRRR